MNVRINKHANPLDWFTLDFHSFENSKKIMNFIEERFPEAKTTLSPKVRYDEYQVTISFLSDEDSAAFKFLWLSHNWNLEIA